MFHISISLILFRETISRFSMIFNSRRRIVPMQFLFFLFFSRQLRRKRDWLTVTTRSLRNDRSRYFSAIHERSAPLACRVSRKQRVSSICPWTGNFTNRKSVAIIYNVMPESNFCHRHPTVNFIKKFIKNIL